MKLLLVTLLSTFVLVGCNGNESEASKFLTVSLLTDDSTDSFKKTIRLFEDDEYLIVTNFDSYISTYPYDVLNGYEEMKANVIQDSVLYDTLQMKDYLQVSGDGLYILAHHLEFGTCLVYDKKAAQIIEIITMEKYIEGEPMQSTVGRRFFINGKLFLETVDLIS
jgi:hypothetical protein